MSKKNLISEEERALFRTAVKNVKPLLADNKIPTHKKPRQSQPIAQKKNNNDFSTMLDISPLSNSVYVASVGAEEFIKFSRTGLQTRVMQRLQRGEFPIEAILDLHGYNLETAHQTLHRFVAHAIKKHLRCIQIIHGKGMRSEQSAPLLKNSVNNWLRFYAVVLAFCSAKTSDGGAGATYVLLKKN